MFVTIEAAAAKHAFSTITDEDDYSVLVHSKSNLSTRLMHVAVDDDPLTMSESSEKGIDVLMKEMARHEKIAQFEQMKFNTENLLESANCELPL